MRACSEPARSNAACMAAPNEASRSCTAARNAPKSALHSLAPTSRGLYARPCSRLTAFWKEPYKCRVQRSVGMFTEPKAYKQRPNFICIPACHDIVMQCMHAHGRKEWPLPCIAIARRDGQEANIMVTGYWRQYIASFLFPHHIGNDNWRPTGLHSYSENDVSQTSNYVSAWISKMRLVSSCA